MRKTTKPRLSKTRITAGLQCMKRLYLMVNAPDDAAEISEAGQLLRDQYYEVGELATRLFKGGLLVNEGHLHARAAVKKTQALVADKSVPAIFKAAFTFDDIHVRVDILERLPRNRWHLIEVKSTTKLKDHHLLDMAIQRYVLEKSGIKISKVSLMHLNREYVYDGKAYKLKKLFNLATVQKRRKPLEPGVGLLIHAVRVVLSKKQPPIVVPGDQCTDPFECEFYNLCNLERPADWIGYLHRITSKKLAGLQMRGIESIKDIPEDFQLSNIQQRMRSCLKKKKPFFSADLHEKLAELSGPVFFMDFETINPALPRHAGMRPYDQLPFQWSVHVLNGNASNPSHFEFLHDEVSDPRKAFIEKLLAVLEQHTQAPVVVYNQGFESGRLSDLAEVFPKYAARIKRVQKRLWDLLPVVREHVYHPKFNGSFSIKRVLPALVQGMSYAGMGVEDGAQAGAAYIRMLAVETPQREKKRLRKDLLQYCAQDTLAMVKIVKALKEKTAS